MMTREEARRISHQSPEVIEDILCEMSATIESLTKRVEELENKIAKLSKNSSNSHKPPSSDDITKPKSKKKKKKGKRSIGGQPGHPKNERPPFDKEEINECYDHTETMCPHCSGQMEPMENQEPQVIQQVEIPESPVVIHEHISYPMWCETCQKIHYGPFPPEVVKEGLFKERITALVAYLKHVCHASFTTIRKYFRDIISIKVSRGYLRKVLAKVDKSLHVPYEELLRRIPLEKIVNVDESGHKENREKFWTWVFKADLYVLFKIDKSRGSKPGMDPTNNVAEQALRFIVIDRHITQGTRSLKGRSTCERIWTVIATCALQGRSAYQFILEAVRSYFHEQPAPSLLPDSS